MTVLTEAVKVINLEKKNKQTEVVRLNNEEGLRSFFTMVRLQTTAWTSNSSLQHLASTGQAQAPPNRDGKSIRLSCHSIAYLLVMDV